MQIIKDWKEVKKGRARSIRERKRSTTEEKIIIGGEGKKKRLMLLH